MVHIHTRRPNAHTPLPLGENQFFTTAERLIGPGTSCLSAVIFSPLTHPMADLVSPGRGAFSCALRSIFSDACPTREQSVHTPSLKDNWAEGDIDRHEDEHLSCTQVGVRFDSPAPAQQSWPALHAASPIAILTHFSV